MAQHHAPQLRRLHAVGRHLLRHDNTAVMAAAEALPAAAGTTTTTTTVFFVRHGHATSNAAVEVEMERDGVPHDRLNAALSGRLGAPLQERALAAMHAEQNFDAALTPRGHLQALSLRRSLGTQPGGGWEGAQLVVSSPLRRAIQTARTGFGEVLEALGQPLLLSDLVRECGGGLSNFRPPVPQMRARYRGWLPCGMDFSQLAEEDPREEGPGSARGRLQLQERALAAWEWLTSVRRERIIMVVSHGGVLSLPGCSLLSHPAVRWLPHRGSGSGSGARQRQRVGGEEGAVVEVRNCEVLRVEARRAAPHDPEGVLYELRRAG
jgi:broad specificity phosphatase PhoE